MVLFEPSVSKCGKLVCCPKGAIENWHSLNAKWAWSGITGREQAKQLIEGFSRSMGHNLLGFKKCQLRMTVGVLTRHWLNGLRDDLDSDYCGEAEDTSIHCLCQCPSFQLIRRGCFVDPTVIIIYRKRRVKARNADEFERVANKLKLLLSVFAMDFSPLIEVTL